MAMASHRRGDARILAKFFIFGCYDLIEESGFYTSRRLNPISPTTDAASDMISETRSTFPNRVSLNWPLNTYLSLESSRSGLGQGSGNSESRNPVPYSSSQNTVIPRTVPLLKAPMTTPHDTITASTAVTAMTAARPPTNDKSDSASALNRKYPPSNTPMARRENVNVTTTKRACHLARKY